MLQGTQKRAEGERKNKQNELFHTIWGHHRILPVTLKKD